MSPTTDPNDPRLSRGADDKPGPQNEVYLVLDPESRAKGLVRPVRRTYRHVGTAGPAHPLRDLTEEEKERYDQFGYVKFEEYPPHEGRGPTGRYWTQELLDSVDKGCGAETTMAQEIAETYARNPHFYGATYCVRCQMLKPVEEFTWPGGSRVGS